MCKSHVSNTYHLSMYDIYCPFRQNNLPVIDWTKYASDTIWPTVFLYHTCLLRVADKNGNAISGATVSLKDSDGATEKTTTTNTDGYFLDEAIAITAATTTTITDSSKSWTVDAHRGKEIIITSGVNAGLRCVVKSNTATQLTLMDAMATACSAGDRAGLPFYALRCAIDHDPATGGGVGSGLPNHHRQEPPHPDHHQGGLPGLSGDCDHKPEDGFGGGAVGPSGRGISNQPGPRAPGS